MAQTEHLPIYKARYDLCLYLEQVVPSFSRYHKYALGTELREGARRVLRLVVRANARRERVPVLLEVREELEQLEVVLRLGQDLKAFPSFGAFEHAITLVVDVARQNEGWLIARPSAPPVRAGTPPPGSRLRPRGAFAPA
jgi:hypothetical protein